MKSFVTGGAGFLGSAVVRRLLDRGDEVVGLARSEEAATQLTRLGASVLSEFVGGGKYSGLFTAGGQLVTLKFSRDDETEADSVGLELAARAGYDPRAGVTLWKKMMAANKGAPPQWLSTHPSGKNRIEEIESHLPEVMPLYERARTAQR